MRAMPATAAAWLGGRIGTAHVDQLARARTGGRAEDFEVAEADLVDTAEASSFFVSERRGALVGTTVPPAQRRGPRRGRTSKASNRAKSR